jgi:mono/diheme cytochrome c family protein
MSRSLRPLLLAVLLLAVSAGVSACGQHGVQLAADSPEREGAELFDAHCSGCHTFSVAGTEGSASNVGSREYKDGPNFDQRAETADDVLFAIENGGFSSGPMPQQILTGEDAKKVADFVAKYSGREAARPPDPQGGNPSQIPSGAEAPEDTQ